MSDRITYRRSPTFLPATSLEPGKRMYDKVEVLVDDAVVVEVPAHPGETVSLKVTLNDTDVPVSVPSIDEAAEVREPEAHESEVREPE